ncbi:hypothetical protein [Pseudonocardia sp. MH-G8]|uniref:hypothetical protein n=1 Tax=Pseudonocardia sp. MH-G8 TaxID=1854588 RepID=UPI000B9FF2C1|nr:hypothetical protein [Pseudonocardia sp. MH-G8]OZM77338.1 hypothetical protein CFP66_36205 [Pseudonocardia sp. MH-G8]
MRKIILLLSAVAAMLLVPGAAAADPGTYEVSDQWALTYVDGRPTVVPAMEDDTVEVSCRGNDQMTDWSVNDQALVGGSWEHTAGTGIFVQPAFTGETEILEITVVCERA